LKEIVILGGPKGSGRTPAAPVLLPEFSHHRGHSSVDPSLTPDKIIALIKQGADKSADGRRSLINPKATTALLKERKIAKGSS